MTTHAIELTEYRTEELPTARLSKEDGELIWRLHRKKISIEEPGFKNDHHWQLSSNGWVGVLPVRSGLALKLRARVPIANIFGMLEIAYRLKSFELFDGITGCASLEEFYEKLANVLARRVLARSRKGLYRAYLEHDERLACVRGRVNVRRALSRPWDPTLRCEYEEHTADIEDNQILTAALGVAARSGLCTEKVLPTVRKAFRATAGFAAAGRMSHTACLGRLYHRLNDDYRPMHALCRFFLEHTGPTLDSGDHEMVPFVIYMPRLFEMFVAEWLAARVPPPYEVRAQHTINFGKDDEFDIQIDLVLENAQTGETIAVMDTKYKNPNRPAASDIEQVVAYASAQGCREAVLIYPARLPTDIDGVFGEGGVRVRSLWFELDGDLDEAGANLLEAMLPRQTIAGNLEPETHTFFGAEPENAER